VPSVDPAPPDLTIPALLATRRREDASLQALVMDERAITFEELDDESRRLAARLVRAGVGTSARVGLLAPNGVDWAVAALAVMRVGGVLVPLSTLLKAPELVSQLNVAAVTHLIMVPRFRGRAYLDELDEAVPGLAASARQGRRHPAAAALRWLWTWDELPTAEAPGPLVDALAERVRPADDMVVLFTSGSRGGPKGVIHTHGGAVRATWAGLEPRRVGRGERLYIPMPFFWTGGFGGGLLTVLVAGATLLTETEPEPGRTIRFLERERATLFRGWPDQAARIAAHPAFAAADLSSLRPASLGPVLPAAARPAPGARANLFGMTETFGPYCGSRLDTDLPEGKHGSCGRPFPGVEARIVDPDTGAGVPPGTEGEIRLRGPQLMRGIRGRERAAVFGADGFYPTGDLGVLDGDGFLWYRGRLDDMFKVKGATVYPTEVEAALRALAGVREAVVTEIRDTGGVSAVGALVVVDPAADAGALDAAVLTGRTRARLSSFKVPTRWAVVDDPAAVPRLASGKPDINGVRRLLTG
jgi:acyl-CoA synthetase (AMP-forming)/AMP-acid ligase II